MSSNLIWEPSQRKTTSLPTILKFALRKKYGSPINATLSSSDSSYLEGLRDAEVDGAQALIDAIEMHGDIAVREEY